MFDELDIQSVLLLIIFLLIIVVLYFLYNANIRERMIQQKLDDFELNCPACPKCPECPDNEGCPACPKCPDLKCPERICPETNVPSVDEIIDGIFPGRDRGMTLNGNFFPVTEYETSCPGVGGAESSVPVGSNISDVVDISNNDTTNETKHHDTDHSSMDHSSKGETMTPPVTPPTTPQVTPPTTPQVTPPTTSDQDNKL
jgi:hypothetical protein